MIVTKGLSMVNDFVGTLDIVCTCLQSEYKNIEIRFFFAFIFVIVFHKTNFQPRDTCFGVQQQCHT
jgi:hypothetical protein